MRKLTEEQLSRVLSECAGPGLLQGGDLNLNPGRCCLSQAATLNPEDSGPGGPWRTEAVWFDSWSHDYGVIDPLVIGRKVTDPEALLRAMEKAGIA